MRARGDAVHQVVDIEGGKEGAAAVGADAPVVMHLGGPADQHIANVEKNGGNHVLE